MSEHASKQAVKDFLGCWKARNFSKMVNFLQLTWRTEHGDKYAKQFLKEYYSFKKLISFEIKESKVVGIFIDYDIEIKYKIRGFDKKDFNDKLYIKKIKARTICESEAYQPNKNGTWGVNPIGALREY